MDFRDLFDDDPSDPLQDFRRQYKSESEIDEREQGGHEMVEAFAEHIATLLENMSGEDPSVVAMALTYLEVDADQQLHVGCKVIGFTPGLIQLMGLMGSAVLTEYTHDLDFGSFSDTWDEEEL